MDKNYREGKIQLSPSRSCIFSFISEDSVEGQIDNSLSLNLYTYVQNNPLIYVDPSGCKEEKLKDLVEKANGTVTYNDKTGIATVKVNGKTETYDVKNNKVKNGRIIVDDARFNTTFSIGNKSSGSNNQSWQQRYTDRPGGTVDINIRADALFGASGGVQIDSEGNIHPYIGPSVGIGGGASIAYSDGGVSHGWNNSKQATIIFMTGGITNPAGGWDRHKYHCDSDIKSYSYGAGFGIGGTYSKVFVF